MIKLKLTFGDQETPKDIEIIEGELLPDAVKRCLEGAPMPEGVEHSDIFLVVVNGHIIEKDFWPVTALKKTDSVLIAPNIKKGETGQLFKQVALIAITVAATAFLGPGAGVFATNLGASIAVAATVVGATLLLNALIPPPVPNLGDAGIGGGYQESQMYAIAGQSNQVKRFGTVPRVYGTHRIFPTVAAIPYTELDVDPATGELIQYLYVVYDFGYGPLRISDIRIGDTPLNSDNFSDFSYKLVDFNPNPSPTTPEEEQTTSSLTYYKGDVEGDPIQVVLSGNQDSGDVQSTWQAIRNSAANTDGVPQEIILNFVNPSGLFSFDAYGNKSYRRIDLEIHFRKVGETTWLAYNDPNQVSYFKAVGGEASNFAFNVRLAPYIDEEGEFYTSYNEQDPTIHRRAKRHQTIKVNGTKLLVIPDPSFEFLVGASVFTFNDNFAGKIVSVETFSENSDYKVLTLDRPIRDWQQSFVWHGTWEGTWGEPTYTWDEAPAQSPGTIRTYGTSVGKAVIQRDTTQPVYSSFRFTPNEAGQYQIRVRRRSTQSPFSTNVGDTLTWTGLTTRFDRSPIQTENSHLFLELKIRATNQLNGSIQNLSAVCTSILDVYDSDTSTWVKQATSNPAWVLADLLTGTANKRAIAKSRLDVDSFLEWAEFCDEVPTPPSGQEYVLPRFQCNFVLDYEATLQEVINQVAGAAQASLNIIDGKYGVLIDKLKTTPVQIFTPRNSKNFSSQRLYTPRPDGLIIKYINPDLDWSVSEVTAYDNGFDKDTATDLQEMTSFACTNVEQAWRFGRYMIAQNRLRQETMSLLVDFEHLVCTRGDYVQITQDVMRVGGSPARVKAVDGTTVTIDDAIDINPLLSYGYVFRSNTGQIKTGTLTSQGPSEFDLDDEVPSVGDLIVIGQVDSIVYDCIVKAIHPNDDMSATLTLVEKADAIYDYESTDQMPEYDPQFSPTTDPEFAPPGLVGNLAISDFGQECAAIGYGYEYFVEMSWTIPAGTIYQHFSIQVNDGRGFKEVATTKSTIYRYIVDPTRLGVEHQFKVIAVSAFGRSVQLAEAETLSSTPMPKSTPPSDIGNLSINITNEVIQLSWDQIDDCDCKEYRIRFTPDTDGTWETSLQLLRVDRNVNLASLQARTGLYLIKAVDFNDNESENPATAITTIPNLFNLNIIEEIDEAPDFEGGYDRVEKTTSAITLSKTITGGIETSAFYGEGYYYYQNVIDLGDIYTSRIQSVIQAEGFTEGDIMSAWETLSSVAALANAGSSEWDVRTEYRTSDQNNVMANWETLSEISAINEGVADNFSEWRPFIISDVTGRVLQFRLKLESFVPNVSPRVFDATIRVDMPDRIESYENLVAGAIDGYTLVYDPAFKGPGTSPNVQVSIDDAESGDYWVFESKTLEGLTIKFFDKEDNQVERQFDLVAKGYGRKYDAII